MKSDYCMYPVISNKSVRQREKYVETYFSQEGGKLQKTNRGYFLNGKNISVFSAKSWIKNYGSQPPKVWRERKNSLFSQKGSWEEKVPNFDW